MITEPPMFVITRVDGERRIRCTRCGADAGIRSDLDATRFKRGHTCERPPRGAAA